MKCHWITEAKYSNLAVSVSVFAMSTNNDDNRDDDTAIIEGLRAFRVETDKKMKIFNSMKEEFAPLIETLEDEQHRRFADAIATMAGQSEELCGVTDQLIELFVEDHARRAGSSR